MAKQTFDVIVIGSGSAGFSAAEAASSLGARVCLIEREKLGGACSNTSCVPSKALLAAAHVYRCAQEAKGFGVMCGTVSYSFESVMHYRDEAVARVTGGGERGARHESVLREMGVTSVFGEAIFEDDSHVVVETNRYEGKTFVLATGSEDVIPEIPGLSQIHFWHWSDALTKRRQPKSLAIIGAGPVGCEVATFYASFGTRVVLLERLDHVLPREDEEGTSLVEQRLQALGVEVVTHARVTEIVDGRGGVYGVHVDVSGQKNMHAVEQVVVATGKQARLMGIENSGVRLSESGSVVVSPEQRTSVKHIFAAGDVCASAYRLTHVAQRQGAVAGYNAALMALNKRLPKKVSNERVIPRVTFVDPEMASVGYTEQEVRRKFSRVLVGRANIADLGRARTDHVTEGVVKLVAHPTTRKVLGACIVSPHAGELIHEVSLAMQANMTIDKLAELMHAFPTYSEGIAKAASQVILT